MLLCAAATLTAKAQWQPSDNDIKTVAVPEEGTSDGLSFPLILQTNEGKTICLFRKSSTKDPEMGFPFDKPASLLFYQVYDVEGNPTLPGEGVCVSKHPTGTDTSGRISATLAPNGDILMAYTDQREYDDKTQAYVDKVYLYRYTQTGESVWSKDGVQLPDMRREVVTATKRGYKDPRVCVSGDYIYFASSYEEVDETANSTYYYDIACLDQYGNILSSDMQPIPAPFCAMSPAPDGTVYFLIPFYYICSDCHCYSLDGMRLGPDCSNMWAEQVCVEIENVAMKGKHESALPLIEDFKLHTYKDGSLLMLYYIQIPYLTNKLLRFNRLWPDGTVVDDNERVEIGNGYSWDNSYDWVIEDGAVTAFCSNVVKYRNKANECHLWMDRFSIDSTPLWAKEGGLSVNIKEGQRYNIVATSTKDGIYYVLYYVTQIDDEEATEHHGQCYVEAYDGNGNLLWNRRVLDGAAMFNTSVCYQDYMMKLLYIQGNESNQKGLMMTLFDPTVEPNAINGVPADDVNRPKAVKRLKNGHIVIESNGETYNLVGIKTQN